jgi:hypothetical protein
MMIADKASDMMTGRQAPPSAIVPELADIRRVS